MKTVWTNGLTTEKKEEIKGAFNASGSIRMRLQKLLEDKIESKRKKNVLESSYDNPNWALLQADAIGFQRALEEVISLISDDKTKKD